MEERKHPTFHRRLTLLFAICFLSSGTLFCDLTGKAWTPLLPQGLSMVLVGVLIFGFMVYALWSGKHVKCPQCGLECEFKSDEPGKGRKVICRRCEIVWDLGTSYNSDSGG